MIYLREKINLMLRSLASALAIVLLLASCNKYTDGPKISLRTKKERLANTWKLEKYLEDDVDKTTDAMNLYYNYTLTIGKKDGHYTMSWRPFNLGDYVESGDWVFVQDDVGVQFTRQSPTPVTTENWKVLRLKEKELWGQFTDSNNHRVEIHLIPK